MNIQFNVPIFIYYYTTAVDRTNREKNKTHHSHITRANSPASLRLRLLLVLAQIKSEQSAKRHFCLLPPLSLLLTVFLGNFLLQKHNKTPWPWRVFVYSWLSVWTCKHVGLTFKLQGTEVTVLQTTFLPLKWLNYFVVNIHDFDFETKRHEWDFF